MIATKFIQVLMPKMLNHKRVDWQGLFLKFDKNNNGYIEKPEFIDMMKLSGITMVTNAEAGFAWNVIAVYATRLDMRTFQNWGRSFEGTAQKRLLYQGQYLDASKLAAEQRPGMSGYELRKFKET